MDGPSDESTNERMIEEPLLPGTITKGGIRTLPFIIANEAFENVASIGLLPNMVVYLTREYRLQNFDAVNILFLWSAFTNFVPILGAFVADSYVGRYRMISFGTIASLLGMVLFWLTAMFPLARPPSCDKVDKEMCEPATMAQLLFLYFSFGLMSIGAGGIRGSSLAFGADQLGPEASTADSGNLLQKYFGWYYAAVTSSAMFSVTAIVYIQDNFGWVVGFGIPVIAMFLSVISFFLASPWYIKLEAKSSLLTRFGQVIAASFKNRRTESSSVQSGGLYYSEKGSMLQVPTKKLRFLNKACTIRDADRQLPIEGGSPDPWCLCTVDQVEELKSLINIIPIWSSGIIFSVACSQNSLIVLLATPMERHIGPYFEFPPGTFITVMVLSLVILVAIYDSVILRLASKIIGKPVHPTLKERMGAGLALSIFATSALAIVEFFRRKTAMEEGLLDEPGVVKMSAMWLLFYYVPIGFAEGLNGIGQNEFYYSELPKSMSSIASALLGVGSSVASLVASLIISIVQKATERRGDGGWIGDDINSGHYDYYFWLITCLCTLNFVYFLACSKAYGPGKRERAETGASYTEADEENHV